MKRSKEFDKHIIIYNETGFFDEFLKMIEDIYKNSFTSFKVRNLYNISNNYMNVLDLLDVINKENGSVLVKKFKRRIIYGKSI